jgi:hypothetical protein
MEFSTKITERLVKQMLPDLGKIVLNYLWGSAGRQEVKGVDTGAYECIFREK